MFHRIGKTIERGWPVVLGGWLLVLIFSMGLFKGWINRAHVLPWRLPEWKDLAEDGEFAHMPQNMPSLVGEKLLAAAFPDDLLKSSIVIIVRRVSQNSTLADEDYEFIENVLKPKLEAIQAEPHSLISSIKTSRDPLIGKMLESGDQRASMLIVALTTEFLSESNRTTIAKIEDILFKETVPVRPVGLDVAISGSATVGRDMIRAAAESAGATELWTTILVVGLLILIYRAPVLAIIPLITVFTSVHVSMAMVTLLSSSGFMGFKVFHGLETYITVVVYGTGVDYCLFLIARYKEEMDNGLQCRQAISSSLNKVGAALVASALTVICGIGMMFFAKFGKFREAGVFISLSLCVGLFASLTLTPAMLRAAGQLAFWPYGRTRKLPEAGGWISGTTLFSRLFDSRRIHRLWEQTGQALLHIPGKAWLTCVVLMTPLAVLGLAFHDYLSYGLLSELQPTTNSVVGAKAVQAHFPAGYAGPLTVILQHPQIDFAKDKDSENDKDSGKQILAQVVDRLERDQETLQLDDIRSMDHPLGLRPPPEPEDISRAERFARAGVRKRKSYEYYVSAVPGMANHVTRFDVLFKNDPFTRESVVQFNAVEKAVREALPASFFDAGSLHLVGPTASIKDLKTVTDQDQIRIDALVLFSVFAILVVLLRQPAISLYLILSVFFSYFVTLGATVVVFWWLNPAEFAGLDWKVPIFLFTILIAIGEDYNIFLMTRIEEEQRLHGPVEGIRVAVLRTGSIISSCGIIMAGTFCSLLAGTLVGMRQLGFALAFGVLLDTFVVRPVLVPAYLVMLFSGRFGRWGKLLGNPGMESAPAATVSIPLVDPLRGPLLAPSLPEEQGEPTLPAPRP